MALNYWVFANQKGLRLTCSTLILFAFSFSALAQVKITLEDEDGLALPGGHISYSSEKSKEVTVLTDLNGLLVIPDDGSKEYFIKSAYVGYLDRFDTLNNGAEAVFRMKVDNVMLNQIVITGQYAPGNPEKSVHKVKVITKEELEKRGAVNLSDALQFETNLRISQDNVLGSAASIQGLSGENVKIMIDGVPVIGRQDGNLDLNQININNIERIEIVEGPLSVNYGSNALAGTINLITKKTGKKKYNAGLNTYYESVGQYNIDGVARADYGKHKFSLSLGRNFFDGWSPDEPYSLLPQSRPADTSRFLQWKPKEQIFGNIQYSFKRKKTTYRLFGDLFRESILNRGMPRAPYYVTAFDEKFITKRYSGGGDLQGKMNASTFWKVLASYNYYERNRYTYIKDLTSLQEELTTNPQDHDTTKIHTYMSRGSLKFLPENKKVNGQVGYDINYEEASGKRIEEGTQSIGDYAIFGSLEWKPRSTWLIKPGMRYAYNTDYQAPVIPSLNVKYQKGRWSVRSSYARGFRAPSLKELYLEFVDINHNIYGNPNLLAERSNNVQFDVSFKRVKKQKITMVEAGLFFNDVFDMITLAQMNNGVNYTYFNAGRFRSQGMELNLNQSFNHWKVSLGMVYTGRSNIQEEEITGNMYYSPEVRTNLTYEFKKWGGNVSAFYKYNGKVPIYNVDDLGSTERNFANAYNMLDLAATKYFWKKKLNWTLGVKNVLDVQNIGLSNGSGGVHSSSSSSVPVAWGRSIFTTLKFNIDWK